MSVLVTGGSGFLGCQIVQRLVARGERVRVFGRGRYPHLERLGVEGVQGDLRDASAVPRACAGIETVYHVGAKAGVWGRRGEFAGINVDGTRNLIEGCAQGGARRLVFTSSSSVVWQARDLRNGDESLPYPARYNCAYPASKAAAERLVLQANGRNGLLTVSLRPHLIVGAGDNHLVPRVVERARRGRLRRIGDGTNLVDIVCVENVAEAHLLAAERLVPGSPVAGQTYFITQGAPVNLWAWINRLLEQIGAPPVRRAISYGAAWATGAILEALYAGLGLAGEPSMTRFVAHQMARSHYFSIAKARRDLGYEPKVGLEEGMRRVVEAMRR